MSNAFKYRISTLLIAAVWLVNGLFCKTLQLVPRHKQIVQEILNIDAKTATILTIVIGILEVLMFIWILSRFATKINALVQIVIVATMNILEFVFVPDLLLWGKFNAVFALLFAALVYFNEFVWHKKLLLNAQ